MYMWINTPHITLFFHDMDVLMMVYIDEATEKENMIMNIPLSDELKKNNPELYERIIKLRYGDE